MDVKTSKIYQKVGVVNTFLFFFQFIPRGFDYLSRPSNGIFGCRNEANKNFYKLKFYRGSSIFSTPVHFEFGICVMRDLDVRLWNLFLAVTFFPRDRFKVGLSICELTWDLIKWKINIFHLIVSNLSNSFND